MNNILLNGNKVLAELVYWLLRQGQRFQPGLCLFNLQEKQFLCKTLVILIKSQHTINKKHNFYTTILGVGFRLRNKPKTSDQLESNTTNATGNQQATFDYDKKKDLWKYGSNLHMVYLLGDHRTKLCIICLKTQNNSKLCWIFKHLKSFCAIS